MTFHHYFERNYGCRIDTQLTYKGMNTIVLQNELVRISILLDKGSDIFELLYKPTDTDFMWRSPSGISSPNSSVNINSPYENYMNHYHGGWQELFPSGSGASYYGGANSGYHGEAANAIWSYKIVKDSPEEIEVLLFVKLKTTPFILEKTISMSSNSPIVLLNEKVINTSNKELHYMWGHHPSFGSPFLNNDCKLSLPDCTIMTQPEPFSNNRFPASTEFKWPDAIDIHGRSISLKDIPDHKLAISDMLYAKNFKDGWYALTNQQIGIGIGLVWPAEMFPYIWIWQEFGGTDYYPWYGNAYALGLEPFTSLPGQGKHGIQEAIENGTAALIPKYGEVHKELKVVIYENNKTVKHIHPTGQIVFE